MVIAADNEEMHGPAHDVVIALVPGKGEVVGVRGEPRDAVVIVIAERREETVRKRTSAVTARVVPDEWMVILADSAIDVLGAEIVVVAQGDDELGLEIRFYK